ncbi:MAG: hypothetical protein K2K95_06260, partial [Muribaculaceae bacterium]|nr:hypothetical protein [Muribaculaceae bacterium]
MRKGILFASCITFISAAAQTETTDTIFTGYLDEVVVKGNKPQVKGEDGIIVVDLPGIVKDKPVSNILEALALFDTPYLINASNRSLKSLVRVENTAELFHNGHTTNPIEVKAGTDTLILTRSTNNSLSLDITTDGETSRYTYTSNLTLSTKKPPQI